MNLFLLDFYDQWFWERRPVPGGDRADILQKSNRLINTRRESAKPVQAGGFLSGLFRRLCLLIHHLQARIFSPRRRKQQEREK